jgi:probable F420-dependent oxidoreductase
VQIDLFHPPGAGDPAEAAVRAASSGFGGFWMPETNHDPFLPLAVAAAEGAELRLGTSIAVAFARSPMTLAHTAWDLAAATDGRFVLGLGSQIEAHVAGRFSMPWSAPVARMRDFVGALRAIWRTWQTGERLRYRGDHYRHVIMTPFFDPGPIEHPAIPVHLAAVGPGMARLVGEVADGIHIHPFHTPRYLDEVVVPAIAEGAARAGRDPSDVEVVVPLFVVTGPDEEALHERADVVRSQIAFYASTPAYRRVLDLHGWDVGERLTAMSKRGEWEQMAALVSDEMLRTVAVVATHDELATAVADRAPSKADRIGLYPAGGLDALSPEWLEVVAAL